MLLLRSVLEARRRVMLEVNVSAEALERRGGGSALPARAHGGAASRRCGLRGEGRRAPRQTCRSVIPEIKASGGTDIVVTRLSQIVP